jgi:antirestriction protein ArdC
MGSIQETEQVVAEALIAAIDAGTASGKYEMPWAADAGVPINATTGRPYAGGFNYFVLACCGMSHGDNRWAGRSQWYKSKNPVRKDQTPVGIFFPRFTCANCGSRVGWGKTCPKGHSVVKAAEKKFSGWGSATVFNNQQTKNPLPRAEVKDVDPTVGYEAAAKIVENMGATVNHGGGRAFYRPSDDSIQLPEAGSFKTTADYWAVSMHEHAHWTGAKSRLARPGITAFTSFGTEDYAYEELVAEMASAFVCSHIGVKREGLMDNHAAYLASWKRKLTDDPGAVRRAANEAGKAMRYLLK